MFEILDTTLFSLAFRFILLVIAGGAIQVISQRALAQFKTSKSVLAIWDEIVICLLIVVAAVIIIMVKPSVIVSFFVKPLLALWEGFLEILRAIGVPI